MRQGLVAWRTTGAGVFQPYYLALPGKAYGRAGQAEEGLRLLTEGLTVVDKTAERYREAELYRLNVLMLGHPGAGQSRLARRLTTILPAMSLAEALETTCIHRVAGLTMSPALLFQADEAITRGLLHRGAILPRRAIVPESR